jgi:ribonuclease G
MYNVDDAVARVDSYIVSVTGAGGFVGDRRLVRIESVGRAAATASLVGGAGDDGGGGGGDASERSANGDPVESSPSRRRRGRRGGRRRSRAQAQNEPNGD